MASDVHERDPSHAGVERSRIVEMALLAVRHLARPFRSLRGRAVDSDEPIRRAGVVVVDVVDDGVSSEQVPAPRTVAVAPLEQSATDKRVAADSAGEVPPPTGPVCSGAQVTSMSVHVDRYQVISSCHVHIISERKRIFLFLRVYDPRFRRGHDPILRCSYGKSSDPDSQVDVIH